MQELQTERVIDLTKSGISYSLENSDHVTQLIAAAAVLVLYLFIAKLVPIIRTKHCWSPQLRSFCAYYQNYFCVKVCLYSLFCSKYCSSILQEKNKFLCLHAYPESHSFGNFSFGLWWKLEL